MKCRQCRNPDTKVLESRESKEGFTIRRRRECQNCGYRFTTFERLEQPPIYVVKRDGTRETFDKQKLVHSMLVACRKRSVGLKDLEDIADWVERTVASSDEREITTSRIGELVLDVLRHLDSVAYVRFASVYRAFTNAEDFARELDILSKKATFHHLPEDLSEPT